MHAGELAKVGFSDVDVEGLALVDVSTSVGHHVNEGALGDLPHCPVQLLQLIRDPFNPLQEQISLKILYSWGVQIQQNLDQPL